VSYVVFENANIFDGTSPELTLGATVVVEGNEIKEVSLTPTKCCGAERIDCRGKTLMPGMIDNHVHIYYESVHLAPPEPPITYRAQYAQKFLRHILSCGFTSVRDVGGGDHGMAMALRDGFLEGPRFYYGGLCLTQTGGHGDIRPLSQPSDYLRCGAEHSAIAIHADGVDECIKATREQLRKGANHIKIMGSGGVMSPNDPLDRCQYSEGEIRAIVDECTRHGAYVAAHCHPPEAIRRCVAYGVRSIEHGTLIDEDTAAFVASRAAYVVPTMAVIFALLEDGSRLGMSETSRLKLLKIHHYALQGLEIMKRAGVKMGFGTDLLGEHHVRHDTEFMLRSEVLTPFEILRSATATNAEILQMGGSLGVIKPGALADLLIVDGNPLNDINLVAENGHYLTHIMVDGRFVKRPESCM
jgi:imidazolonepropionase-like amidohydrolase